MRQGEIWYADLDPVQGSEQAGKRPIVIVSGNTLNETLPILIVVPISSKVKSYPLCIKLEQTKTNGLKQASEAISFQVRTVSKKRLTKRIGRVTEEQLREIIRSLFIAVTH